jgi:hypothetical protein
VIHIEELEIELIKTGSQTYDEIFELSARDRHEKTQGEVNKMILRLVQTQSCEINKQTNISKRRL